MELENDTLMLDYTSNKSFRLWLQCKLYCIQTSICNCTTEYMYKIA